MIFPKGHSYHNYGSKYIRQKRKSYIEIVDVAKRRVQFQFIYLTKLQISLKV